TRGAGGRPDYRVSRRGGPRRTVMLAPRRRGRGSSRRLRREIHGDVLPLGGIGDLPQLGRRGARQSRDQHGRELTLLGVVVGRRVVVELASERDLVFGGGQLLLQLRDVAGGLELR